MNFFSKPSVFDPIALGSLRGLAGGASGRGRQSSLQFAAQAQETQPRDTSALKPPAGARVAIVEFDDLECPACAHANPILKGAAEKYKIPWVRHDFIIPTHIWSRNAAIYARWFDTKSQALGDEYRDQVFANQTYIYNLGMLSQFTEKFAAEPRRYAAVCRGPAGQAGRGGAGGQRSGQAHRDHADAHRLHRDGGQQGSPFIQVKSVDQDLYQDIDQARIGCNTRGLSVSVPDSSRVWMFTSTPCQLPCPPAKPSWSAARASGRYG